MTYAEAMARYGSDKPDLRFGSELTDLTGYFAGTEFRVFQAEYVGAVVMPGGASQTRKELDGWQDWAKSRGATRPGLRPDRRRDRRARAARSPRTCPRRTWPAWPPRSAPQPGDASSSPPAAGRHAQELLGAARLEIGRGASLIDESAWEFLWVVDCPMFEPVEDDEGEQGWTAVHHPFTSPNDGVRSTPSTTTRARRWRTPTTSSATAPRSAAARSVSTAATCRSGSSTLIGHRPTRRPRRKFGFLLEAFTYGPPPHGGIAFGLDRSSCCWPAPTRSATSSPSRRPASGYDPLTGAPTPITAAAAQGGRRRRRPRQGPQGRGGGRRAGAAGRELTRRNRSDDGTAPPSARGGARRPVDVVDAVDGADGLQHVPEVLGSPISNVNRLTATRSRVVVTDADRMFTCWSDSTRVTSDSSRGRSSASTWIATRKTESSRGRPLDVDQAVGLRLAGCRR